MVRYALSAIKNVGEQSMFELVQERIDNGPYKDIFDFCRRLDPRHINRRQLENLIKAGVFDSIHPNRRQLFEGIDLLTGYSQAINEEKHSDQISLFGDVAQSCPQPALPKTEDWPPLERMQLEFDAIGFHLSGHPLEGYASALRRLRAVPAVDLPGRLGTNYAPIQAAGIVTGRKFKVSDRGRFAFVQLSDPSGMFEISIFNEELLSTARDRLEPGTLLFVKADGKLDDSGMRLIATELIPLDDVTKDASTHTLTIRLENATALGDIKQLIGNTLEKGTQILFKAPLPALGTSTVEIPGRYYVSIETILRLRQLRGVAQIEEA